MPIEEARTLVAVGPDEYANVTYNDGSLENIELSSGARTAGHVVGTEVGTIWLDQDTENGISCTFGEQESATWSWWTYEPNDCLETAKNLFFALKPTKFEGLVWKDGTVTRAWEGKYRVDMTYANTSLNETTVCRIGASTGGGSQHIKTGYSHLGSGYRGGSFDAGSNEFEGAINVGDDNEVQGLDIVARRMQWWVEAYVAPTTITFAYMHGLAAITGTMNVAEFAGFAAGELLFLGANFSGKQFRYVPVTFEFLASPNVTGASIAGMPSFNKLGHDYLWTSFEEKTGTNRLLTRPEGYHIERVYEFGNFSALGINC